MNIIVAVDKNWGIGCSNKLLTSIPEDMRFFKEKTSGKTVVMGHSTLKSLPNSKPLANRNNIVLSRNKDLLIDGVIVCNDLKGLFEELKKNTANEVFVIGGQEIYSLLLPFCKYAYITKIFAEFTADKHFPNVDEMENWKIIEMSETKISNNIEFAFLKYENLSV